MVNICQLSMELKRPIVICRDFIIGCLLTMVFMKNIMRNHQNLIGNYNPIQKRPIQLSPNLILWKRFRPPKNKDRMFNSNHISSVLFKHRAKAAAFALVLLLLGSLGLNKIHVTGNLGGFNAPGVTVFEDAKAFDSLFGGVRSNVVVSVTPKKNAQYSMWKECAEIENGIRKLSPSIEIISPRRFIRGYYGVVDPSHSISTDSLLSALSTHPQLGRLISKDQTSFLLLLRFRNDSIPQEELQLLLDEPRSQIARTRVFGLVQLEKAIENDSERYRRGVVMYHTVFCLVYFLGLQKRIVNFFAIVMMGTSIWMTFCLYHLFGYQITVITVLALPIVLVLSLSDAIHLLSGLSHEKDIESLLSKFIAPSLYSSATTAVAFFSFSFSDSPLSNSWVCLPV